MSRNFFQHSTNYKTLNGLSNQNSFQGVDTNLLPSVDAAYDIGSPSFRWQDVFALKMTALGGQSEFTSVDVKDVLKTVNLQVTGATTWNDLTANTAYVADLRVDGIRAPPDTPIDVTSDMVFDEDKILFTNKLRSAPEGGGTITCYDNLTVLGTLNYTLPPAASGVFGTLGDTEIGDLVTDPLDASPPEAANSNLQPIAERVLSAPTINATQWISTPFLTLMGLAQTDKLKVTSDKVPASKTDYNECAFWNEGGAIIEGNTYIDASCIPNEMHVVSNATVGGTLGVTGATTLGASLTVTGSGGLPAQANTGNMFIVGNQGGGNSGRIVIGDGTGWSTRLSKRISSTTTDLVSFHDDGKVKIGQPSDGSGYNSIANSLVAVQSSHAHTVGDHSGTLMVLDNSTTDGATGGKGGSVVFAGPYDDAGTNFYGAAGRIRGVTSSSSGYGGDLVFETAAADGGIYEKMRLTRGGNLGVTGTLSTTSNATVGGTLGVTGATTLSSLSASGNATVGGTLGVTGATTLAGTTVDGVLTIQSGSFSNTQFYPGDKAGVPLDGWTSVDPNGGSLSDQGHYFYGKVQIQDGISSDKTGAATSTTAGPNVFSGGIACNGFSYFNGINVTSFPSITTTTTGDATSTVSGPNNFAGGISTNSKSFFASIEVAATSIHQNIRSFRGLTCVGTGTEPKVDVTVNTSSTILGDSIHRPQYLAVFSGQTANRVFITASAANMISGISRGSSQNATWTSYWYNDTIYNHTIDPGTNVILKGPAFGPTFFTNGRMITLVHYYDNATGQVTIYGSIA